MGGGFTIRSAQGYADTTRQDIDPGEGYGITMIAPRLHWEEKTLDFHCMIVEY
jgi:hypothetical protein